MVDPEGRRSGFQSANDIPGSAYVAHGDKSGILIVNPEDGRYRIEIDGAPHDRFSLLISRVDFANGLGDPVADRLDVNGVLNSAGRAAYAFDMAAPPVVDVNPRETKLQIGLDLAAFLDAGRFGKAVADIEDSLDPVLWLNAFHLEEKHGRKVFTAVQRTVGRLLDVARAKDTRSGSVARDRAAQQLARQAIDALVIADRTLADIALSEAATTVNPGSRWHRRVAKQLIRGARDLAKGDAAATAGRDAQAIERYRAAWVHSMKAVALASHPDRDDGRGNEDEDEADHRDEFGNH